MNRIFLARLLAIGLCFSSSLGAYALNGVIEAERRPWREYAAEVDSPTRIKNDSFDLLLTMIAEQAIKVGEQDEAAKFLESVVNRPLAPDEQINDVPKAYSDQGKAEVALAVIGKEEYFKRIARQTFNSNPAVRHEAMQKLYELRRTEYESRIEVILAARLGDTGEIHLEKFNGVETKTIGRRAQDILPTMTSPGNKGYKSWSEWRDGEFPDLKRAIAEAIGEPPDKGPPVSLKPRSKAGPEGKSPYAQIATTGIVDDSGSATPVNSPEWMLLGLAVLSVCVAIVIGFALWRRARTQ